MRAPVFTGNVKFLEVGMEMWEGHSRQREQCEQRHQNVKTACLE